MRRSSENRIAGDGSAVAILATVNANVRRSLRRVPSGYGDKPEP
jgi:hypothetical protein